MPNGWIVARTKPHREKWAAENIQRQGYDWYFPRTIVFHRRGARAEPLFHCYIFVLTPGPWNFLLNTFGISSVVTFCNSPAMISQTEIDNMKAAEVDGCIVLPKPEAVERFAANSQVRIKGGLFSGYTGLYEGMDSRSREKVLIEFLGRKTTVLLDRDLVEAAA